MGIFSWMFRFRGPRYDTVEPDYDQTFKFYHDRSDILDRRDRGEITPDQAQTLINALPPPNPRYK